jgi:hypothetical protein
MEPGGKVDLKSGGRRHVLWKQQLLDVLAPDVAGLYVCFGGSYDQQVSRSFIRGRG